MGRIKGLENYCMSKIAQEINIRDEIAKWRSKHGEKPTIIVDIKELNRVLGDRYSKHSFANALNVGGQYWKFNEILDYFFREMQDAGANLMFFARLNESRYRDLKHWESSSLYPNERLLFNLMQICPKYGRVSVNYGMGKCPILAYAREHRDQVMALITRNGKFLVYDIDFSYWCLGHANFYDLKIVQFCPKQLLHEIGLNTKQMQMILALCLFDANLKFRIVGGRKLHHLVEFVKQFEYGDDGFNLNGLTQKLTKEELKDFEDKLDDVFATNDYAGDWNDDTYDESILVLTNNDRSFKSLLQFCKENNYFAYKLINEKDSTQKDLMCIELRQENDVIFNELMIELKLKMCGVLFKDVEPKKRPTTRTVQIHGRFGAIPMEMKIIYPEKTFPSHDLLVKEDAKFDDSRWELFQWLIGLDNTELIDGIKQSETSFLRTFLWTLTFLLMHKEIDEREAKVIHQMESERARKIKDDLSSGSVRPSELDQSFRDIIGDWAQTAHKYTIVFEMICHCLEVCGLRCETAPILFDAAEFNARMQRNEGDPIRNLTKQLETNRL